MGDLVDVATERPLRYGGEVADLVRLATRFRVSAADDARSTESRRSSSTRAARRRRREIRRTPARRAGPDVGPAARDPGRADVRRGNAAAAVLPARAPERAPPARGRRRQRRARPGLSADAASSRAGDVRELAGQPDAPRGHVASNSRAEVPPRLRPALLRRGRPRAAATTRPAAGFPRVPPARARVPGFPGPTRPHPNGGEADFALQLAGDSDAAVNCAAVECWKLIEDERLPLDAWRRSRVRPPRRARLARVPRRRQQHRVRPTARRDRGGTRPAVDGRRNLHGVPAPRGRSRPPGARSTARRRSSSIGRDKLSGACATASRARRGRAGASRARRLAGRDAPTDRAAWRDPPQTADPLLEASHVHRANQNRASPAAPAACACSARATTSSRRSATEARCSG